MGILENNIRTLAEEFVDNLGNGFFIAGNGIGRKDNRISRSDGNFLVHVGRHTGKRRHAFALAAGGDDNLLLVGIILQLVYIDKGLVRYIQVA